MKSENPYGTTMNSCTSTLVAACAPPFRMFIKGTGITPTGHSPGMDFHNGIPFSLADALRIAGEQPKIEFAPSRLLFGSRLP